MYATTYIEIEKKARRQRRFKKLVSWTAQAFAATSVSLVLAVIMRGLI